MKLAFALGVVVLALSACTPRDPTKPLPAKFQLEGSATQLYDFGYDEARILVTDTDIALLFVRTRALQSVLPDGGFIDTEMTGMSEDYPIKITYSLWGEEHPLKRRVNLAEVTNDEAKNPRAVVSRDVLNDPRKKYPKIQIGTMILNNSLAPGNRVSGDFNVTFTNGTETASGRTVFGSFNARVAQ